MYLSYTLNSFCYSNHFRIEPFYHLLFSTIPAGMDWRKNRKNSGPERKSLSQRPTSYHPMERPCNSSLRHIH